MKRFFNNHRKHTTTAMVLLAWLSALGSGIANACLLEGARGTHHQAAGVEQSPHSHAPAPAHTGVPDHDSHVSNDTEQPPPTKALCLDACDERTHAMVKQDVSVAPPHFAPLTVIAVVWLAAQTMESAVRTERDNRTDLYDVPIRVRYSRLTL